MIYALGEKVVLKKKHVCGGDEFEIVRVGADVKLKCLTCGRVFMLDTVTFDKRLKRRVTVEGNE